MLKKRNLTKEKILETSRELAKEIGVNQLSFQNIANALDIKYPSLYNYFTNIKELRIALTAMLLEELNLNLQRVLVGRSGDDAIRTYAHTYEQFAFDNKAVYELMINIPHTKNEELFQYLDETNRIIRQILEYYHLDELETLNKSRNLRSLIHGFISLRFLGYFSSEEEVTAEESFTEMIEEFIRMLNGSSLASRGKTFGDKP